MGEPGCDLSRLSLMLFCFERIDEFNSGEEPDAFPVMLDSLNADCRGEMRLARARTANQDGVMGVLQELAAMKLMNEGFIDLATGKIEACEVPIARKAGGFQLISG